MRNFLDILAKRRSIYALNDQLPISDNEVEKVVKQAVRLSPSAFNSQTSRVAFLWKKEKEKFWAYVKELLQPLTPKEAFPNTQKKLASFAKAALVCLFFEDVDIVASLQKQFSLYADNFPIWSEQSSGIATVNAWTALAERGVACNLQHYNPVVDEKAAKEWHFPSNWKLRGQLVVGGMIAPAGEKEFMADEKRFKSFGI
ncbi:MAG: nitroreductase family protein [Lactobacillales bacterium]|jgi:predicted oxidoreductase (fatty acid repression mutant protein)|nr:nitroreductase family protein [Lactobacillales bacterium]